MNKENFPKVVVVGLGKTGLSIARFLAAKGELFAVVDSRENPPALGEFKAEFPAIPLYLRGFDVPVLNSAQKLIVSPGISLEEEPIARAMKRGAQIIGDVELFAQYARAPVIAITGSNAKSTVTTLIGYLLESAGLKVAVGGNLGTPALDLLAKPTPDYFILELSSFQLEETFSLAPLAATILNISPDHMDRYKTFSQYVAAKQRIFRQSTYQLVNRDDQNTYPICPSQVISFGSLPPDENAFGLVTQGDEIFLCFGKVKLISTRDLLIKGRHNWLNVLAALGICHIIGISLLDVLPALKKFRGLVHRCEFVTEQKGISWYNDSKGTNVGATAAALEGLGSTIVGKLIWIAGGIGKNADFSPLKGPVNKYVRKAVLIGQDAKLIQQDLQSETEIILAESFESAIKMAYEMAVFGDAVLLSPACASFDMFKNFEHRGEVFKNLVSQLYFS